MPKNQHDDLREKQEKNILVDFIPAVLKNTRSEGYLIEYHFRDKIANKLIRKRYYLNRIVNSYQKKSDGINHARRIVREPFEDDIGPRVGNIYSSHQVKIILSKLE